MSRRRRCRRGNVCFLLAVAVIWCVVLRILQGKGHESDFLRLLTNGAISTSAFNVSLWDRDVCRGVFVDIEHYPKYPYYPDATYLVDAWSELVEPCPSSCIRLARTSLTPTHTGFHTLRVIASAPFRIILGTRGDVISWQESGDVTLSRRVFLYKHVSYSLQATFYSEAGQARALQLQWQTPASGDRFEIIPPRYFHPGVSTGNQPRPEYPVLSPDPRRLISDIPRVHLQRAFPTCDVDGWFGQRITVYEQPEQSLPRVAHLVNAVMKGLEAIAPRRYPSYNVTKLEISTRQPVDKATERESRLLVDLELIVDGLDYKQKLTEYFAIHRHDNGTTLCRPTAYAWNPLRTVNLVFLSDCSRDERAWVDLFIANMADLLQTTLDVNFEVTITTCDETLAAVYDSRLADAGFTRYAVVHLRDPNTSVARGLHAAMSLAEVDDDVVVLCRRRLYLPAVILEEIRQHTFRGRMAYAPEPLQLGCGHFPTSTTPKQSPQGSWCKTCPTLVALFKKDWNRILNDYGDNQTIQSLVTDNAALRRRIVQVGIEIIQVQLSNLYRV